MLQQITIGKRLFIAFTIALTFVIVVAGAGQWALKPSADTAAHVLDIDFAINSAANDAHIAVLDLRRFEKDYIINIGDKEKEASYLQKWNESRLKLDTQLSAIEKLPISSSMQDGVRSVRSGVAEYGTGFQNVVARITSGELKTAADANREIAPVKDSIRSVEVAALSFDDESTKAMQEKKKVITST